MCVNELGGNEWAGRSCDRSVKHAEQYVFFSISMTDKPNILRNNHLNNQDDE
ncbi:hypothetical protein R3I94_005967 [Phoxinus phoxinus]